MILVLLFVQQIALNKENCITIDLFLMTNFTISLRKIYQCGFFGRMRN